MQQGQAQQGDCVDGCWQTAQSTCGHHSQPQPPQQAMNLCPNPSTTSVCCLHPPCRPMYPGGALTRKVFPSSRPAQQQPHSQPTPTAARQKGSIAIWEAQVDMGTGRRPCLHPGFCWQAGAHPDPPYLKSKQSSCPLHGAPSLPLRTLLLLT
jgi:hypothetical protein